MPKDEMDIGDLVGAVYMILGIVTFIGGILFNIYWTAVAQILDASGTVMLLLNADKFLIMMIAILIGTIEILAGYMVWQRYDAGRILACILAIFSVVAFPIGTIISLVTWYALLVHKPTKDGFKKIEWNELSI